MRPLSFAVAYNRLLSRARLRHLQLIVSLSDQGSLKGAAMALGLSQPAVTQLLSDLEALLGTRLFIRHSRGVHPTPSCEALVPVLRLALRSIELAVHSLSRHSIECRQRIRIGCVSALAASAFCRHLVAELLALPDQEISIQEGSLDHLLADLMTGRLDAVCGRRPSAAIPGLRFVPVASDQALAMVCRSHPLAGRFVPNHKELARFPWVFFDSDPSFDSYVNNLIVKFEINPSVTRICTNSTQFLFSFLHKSERVCIVPSSLAFTASLFDAFDFINISLPSIEPTFAMDLGWILRNDGSRSGLEEWLSTTH